MMKTAGSDIEREREIKRQDHNTETWELLKLKHGEKHQTRVLDRMTEMEEKWRKESDYRNLKRIQWFFNMDKYKI